mgnify:CR=1 FL=1
MMTKNRLRVFDGDGHVFEQDDELVQYYEGEYKDGKLHGKLTQWHKNGQKRDEREFNNGIREGLWTHDRKWNPPCSAVLDRGNGGTQRESRGG